MRAWQARQQGAAENNPGQSPKPAEQLSVMNFYDLLKEYGPMQPSEEQLFLRALEGQDKVSAHMLSAYLLCSNDDCLAGIGSEA